MLDKDSTFAFILNPVAGRGNALRFEDRILHYLKEKKVNFSFHKSEAPEHATDIAKNLSGENDVIVAVGGDGTAHEVASGIMGSNASLGILPVGSGNDFNRIFGMPSKVEHAIEVMLSGIKKRIDVGHIETQEKNTSNTKKQFFFNSLGIGLDAEVAAEARRTKLLRGLPLYLYAAIKVLIKHKAIEYEITLDDWKEKSRNYLICIGNGCFEGGGFKLTPNADPTDQKLDVCIIPKISIAQALPIIPKIIKGTHVYDSRIKERRVKFASIRSDDSFVVHADGEIIGEKITSIRIKIAEDQLGIIVPKIAVV